MTELRACQLTDTNFSQENKDQSYFIYHLLSLDVCGEVRFDEKDDYHDE